MRKTMIFFFIVALVLLSGCASDRINVHTQITPEFVSNLSEKASLAYDNYSEIERQQNLDHLAKVFAQAVNSSGEVKSLLNRELEKKFDGTYDVLYDLVADSLVKPGKTLNKVLFAIDQNIETLASSIPYFNISVPVNFDRFAEYSGEIYVIPMRYDIDDMDIEVLYGYDGQGSKKAFYASEKPEIPVIVLGINERVTWIKAQVRKFTQRCLTYKPLGMEV